MSERFQVAVETQLALPEVAFESGHKLTAKDATEHLDGKEEGVAGLDPMIAIGRQSAGGHDTVHVRVMFEFLIPGVEHTEETDLGAEMFGIASDSEEGCGTGLQQEMVQEFLVLQGERRQFMGEREDNMDVARGEKLLTTRLEPTSTGVGLTLWAVPVAAAVVRNGRMVATVDAFIEMPAQGGGATACDGPQHGDVLPGDPPAASFDEGASRGANQIGHLKWRPVHLRVLR